MSPGHPVHRAPSSPGAPDASAIDLFARIGRDHALRLDDLGEHTPRTTRAAADLWAAYDKYWRRFCGASLDPQFWRFECAARWSGAVAILDANPVVVVGTGPSLRRALPDLRRVRRHVHVFTSLRGAEVLAAAGLTPDVVLLEHQTALDAQFSVRDRACSASCSLTRAPLVIAEPATPPALLAGVSLDRLVVPDALPTWGLWPATAVALALAGGARMVALLGIDLGRTGQPDPAQAPLRTILELLAAYADVPCVDLGRGSAEKRGWRAERIDGMAGGTVARELGLDAKASASVDERLDVAEGASRRVKPLIGDADSALRAALRVRDGDRSPFAQANLERGLARMLRAGDTLSVRRDVQEGLGASFLPRYWRTPPDMMLGPALWRAGVLAAHELIAQDNLLRTRLIRNRRQP